MVERQIARRGIRDARILAAFRAVPREEFVPEGMREFAYDDGPLPIGEALMVSFGLPGYETPLTARCRVAWWYAGDKPLPSKSLPPGLGLQFVELSDADKKKLYYDNAVRILGLKTPAPARATPVREPALA